MRDLSFADPEAALRELGLALVALGRATGEPRWAEAAIRVARATREQLEDASGGGGFFAATARSTDKLLQRRKPFAENV